ncbi:hypothetical protein ACQEV2_42450 [Streptomyces sp. CA-251387]|uniref:hypothetical protein n=1 Tax=Streptomyces sp. CA-251387 TaxID=3240064 RepID=UPI003D8CF7E3
MVGEVHADLGGVRVKQVVPQGQVSGGDHMDGVGEALGDVPGERTGDGADNRGFVHLQGQRLSVILDSRR